MVKDNVFGICIKLHYVLFILDDYTVARKKRNKAQEYSDLESDDAQRIRKPLIRHEEDSDTDSEVELEIRKKIPAPPKFSKGTYLFVAFILKNNENRITPTDVKRFIYNHLIIVMHPSWNYF